MNGTGNEHTITIHVTTFLASALFIFPSSLESVVEKKYSRFTTKLKRRIENNKVVKKFKKVVCFEL